MMIALIDGDILTYSIPFSLEDYKTKELKGGKWECREMLSRMISTIMEETKASSYKLFLSGKDNFREDIATLSPYKGNRSGEKPFFHSYIRKLAINEYGAIISQGQEADDDIATEQDKDKDNTIICSLDKDFAQCAGMHFQWAMKRKGKLIKPHRLFEIGEEEAERNLHVQAITGDTVDNILYADGKKLCFKGKGEKFAQEYLKECNTREDCKAKTMEWYYKEFPQDELELGWKEGFSEVMDLLYLRKAEGDCYG